MKRTRFYPTGVGSGKPKGRRLEDEDTRADQVGDIRRNQAPLTGISIKMAAGIGSDRGRFLVQPNLSWSVSGHGCD